MHKLRDPGIVHQRKRTVGAESGVVHEAVNRSEVLAQSGDEALHFVDLAEIEWNEPDGVLALPRSLGDCSSELLAFPAGDSDGAISGRGELLDNGKTETAAAAGDHDIAHHERPWRRSLPVSDTV